MFKTKKRQFDSKAWLHISAQSALGCSDSIRKSDARLFSEQSTPLYHQLCNCHSLCSVGFFSEHTNATQFRQSATASTDYCIRMHESEVQTILYQSVCLRSAPYSCEKCEYLVRQPYDAKRNNRDKTCWCDHFCSYRNRAQRCASHDGCA